MTYLNYIRTSLKYILDSCVASMKCIYTNFLHLYNKFIDVCSAQMYLLHVYGSSEYLIFCIDVFFKIIFKCTNFLPSNKCIFECTNSLHRRVSSLLTQIEKTIFKNYTYPGWSFSNLLNIFRLFSDYLTDTTIIQICKKIAYSHKTNF